MPHFGLAPTTQNAGVKKSRKVNTFGVLGFTWISSAISNFLPEHDVHQVLVKSPWRRWSSTPSRVMRSR